MDPIAIGFLVLTLGATLATLVWRHAMWLRALVVGAQVLTILLLVAWGLGKVARVIDIPSPDAQARLVPYGEGFAAGMFAVQRAVDSTLWPLGILAVCLGVIAIVPIARSQWKPAAQITGGVAAGDRAASSADSHRTVEQDGASVA